MFAERFKRLRVEAGKSQRDIAVDLNVSQPTVGLWESGKREPSIETLMRAADYFRVTSDYLLGRSDDPYYTHTWTAADGQTVTAKGSNKNGPTPQERETVEKALSELDEFMPAEELLADESIDERIRRIVREVLDTDSKG